MQPIIDTISSSIQLQPIYYTVRNVLILIGIAYVIYRFIFSSHGSTLRQKLPFLQFLATKREVRKLIKMGEHAYAAELCLRQGWVAQAIDAFIAGGLFGRAADIHLQRGHKDKAAMLYERAGLHQRAAQIYVERKDFERAEKNLSKIGRPEEIASLYEKMGSKSLAADAYLRMNRVRQAIDLYSAQKEFQKAALILRDLYSNSDTIYGGDLGYPDQKALVTHCAELFVQANLPQDAVKILKGERMFEAAAEVYLGRKEYEPALELLIEAEQFDRAAKINMQLGRHNQAYSLEAEAHMRAGREEEAAKAFVKGADFAKAGDVYRNLQEFIKAAEMYEKAREYALAGSMYRDAEEFERAGQAYEKAKQFDDAIQCYAKAGNHARQVALLEKQKRYLEAAENYFRRDLVDEAQQVLDKITPEQPDYRKACSLYGKILVKQNKLSQAKVKLEAAISEVREINQDNVGSVYDLAMVSEKLGEKSETLYTIEKMLAEDFVKKHDAATSVDPLDEIKKRLSLMLTQASRRSTAVISSGPRFADATSMEMPGGGASKRYVPIKEIGKGGMGIVYTAKDMVLDRVVALKVLPTNLKKNQQAVATFMREAKSAASLNHKNIVTVFDAGMQDGDYYIAMELIDGQTVKDIIKQEKILSLKSTYGVLKQLLEGLEYAHSRKIVHRDLTTNNIMWSPDKLVKIMDFGLAKVISDLQSEQSIIGGTPSYMSPEQTLGNPIDHRTDLYSLGVCLYEMITGELPFKKGNLGYHHVHTPAPDPKRVNPKVPDALAALILKCMEKDPARRPQSVGAVYELLKKEREFTTV